MEYRPKSLWHVQAQKTSLTHFYSIEDIKVFHWRKAKMYLVPSFIYGATITCIAHCSLSLQCEKMWVMYVIIYIYCYFDSELCWHNYCAMLNESIMTLECSATNPLRKQMFHQVCIDLRSLIIVYVSERYFKFWYNASSS